MPIIYANPVFYVFLATCAAFILTTLTIFSIPIVSTFYFLYSTQANGVRFGMWGWCLDDQEGTCSTPPQLGYTWEPQIPIPITSALVFYPITMVLVFFLLICQLPILCVREVRNKKVFQFFAWISFASSALAFVFMMAMWGVAKSRFEKRGFEAHYGNLPWISLAATLSLLGIAIGSHFVTPSSKREIRFKLPETQPRKRRATEKRKVVPVTERQTNKDIEAGLVKPRRRESETPKSPPPVPISPPATQPPARVERKTSESRPPRTSGRSKSRRPSLPVDSTIYDKTKPLPQPNTERVRTSPPKTKEEGVLLPKTKEPVSTPEPPTPARRSSSRTAAQTSSVRAKIVEPVAGGSNLKAKESQRRVERERSRRSRTRHPVREDSGWSGETAVADSSAVERKATERPVRVGEPIKGWDV